VSVPWTPGLRLVCPSCDAEFPPAPAWHGCATCGDALETRYADADRPAVPVDPALLTDLGRTPTPVVEWPDGRSTWLKLEYRNPTASHKDRFHAVTSAIARLAGAPGVVTTSTGNHGVSCAAHAARDGLRCVVLSTTELPRALEAQIAGYGAVVGMVEDGDRRRVLGALVGAGWHPTTSSDHSLAGVGNPFGSDGYRAVAAEIVHDLARVPDAVAVPAASGDTVLGVLRGFEEIAARSRARMPSILACQPAGAASLEASLSAGQQVVLVEPRSIARSTSDPASGRGMIRAIAHGVLSVVVPDELIADTTKRLAAGGHYVETSSALALAGLEQARATGQLRADALGVALLTATGRGWSENEPAVAPARGAIRSADDLLAAVA
jgi:threonine synthase